MTKTEIREVPVEVVKPLPESLTDPLEYPASLPEGFSVGDLLDLVFAQYEVIDAANIDRAKTKDLTTPAPSVGSSDGSPE